MLKLQSLIRSSSFVLGRINPAPCSRLLKRQNMVVFSRDISLFCDNAVIGCSSNVTCFYGAFSHPVTHEDVRSLTKPEWEKRLTPEQFSVCREQCTEPPFSGVYNSHFEKGTYTCVCCGVDLFSSEAKYDSGTGWPSFQDSYKSEDGHTNVIERPENRAESNTFTTEVICKKCDSHLGHVFDDGPEPTGKRYCINSVALSFKPKGK